PSGSLRSRQSAAAARRLVSATDTGEGVLEVEERGEPRGLLEAAAVEHARELEEVERGGGRVEEAEAEERPVEPLGYQLRERHRDAAGLADGDLERHGTGPDHVEDSVRSRLQRERDRLADVLFVDELHHRVVAEDGGDVALLQVAADRAVDVVPERVHRAQDRG